MMQDKHTFFIENTEYIVELVKSDYEGPLHQTYGFIFHCREKGKSISKAISISITDRVIGMWSDVGGNKEITENKDVFAWQLIPHFLPKILKKDTVRVFIHLTDEIEKKVGVTYIKASSTISGTARSIIFSDEKPSNNLIRREILKVCYNYWQNEPHGFAQRTELLKFIPVTEVELERNLDYLVKSFYIEGGLTTGGYIHVKITPRGIDLFEDRTEFERRFALRAEQQTVNVGGDMITTILVGNDNQNIIKSKITKTAEDNE
jgi:hypothetical protein